MSRESGNATKFSLMSFNIAHGRGLSLYQGFHSSNSIRKNLEKIARIVREHSPDIVAFQEIDQSSHWNKHIDLLKHIQDETGYPHSEHGIHNTRFGRKPLCYGNAFLSKHPILNCQVHPFGEKTVGEKGFMEAQVQLGDQAVDIINLHLDFRSRRTRIAQIESILKRIKRLPLGKGLNPPIICGDFNTGSKAFSDAVRQFMIRSAQHVQYTYHPQNERTFPAHFPSRGLDFVLAPKPYKVSAARAIKSFASDHLPVLIELSAPSNAKKLETKVSSFI
jgi:endonuclease/exonuclease/phosphatase family metal-dependent hydrolase